ncbi:MAG: sugar transferase [Planctomycetota bacterium]
MFLRERSRANRSLRPLSVIALQASKWTAPELESAARLLRPELRSSDDLGRLDSKTLAVLAPETCGEGAWVLADRLQNLLADAKLAVDAEVFTHGFGRLTEQGGVERPTHGANGSESRWTRQSSSDRSESAPISRRNGTPPLEHPTADRPASRNGHHESGSEPKNGSTHSNGSPQQVPPGPGKQAAHEDMDIASMADVRRALAHRPVGDLWEASCKHLSPWRRAVDVLVSGAALLVLSPIFLLVAIAIKATSPGPVFFKQKRAGVGGRPFTFYKFRSMYIDAEERRKALEAENEKSGPIFKIKNDPRLTRVGRFLRRTSLDELPQFYNVLTGDMTLIGPRPPTLNEIVRYEPWQRDRLAIPGGLTCIWQVSGRSDVGFEDWVRMDLRYMTGRTPLLDASLMTRTVRAVVSGRGAY